VALLTDQPCSEARDAEALIRDAPRRTRRRRARMAAVLLAVAGVALLVAVVANDAAVEHGRSSAQLPAGSGGRMCRSHALSLSVTDSAISPSGTGHAVFVVRNTRAESCLVSGVPRLALTDAMGKVIYAPPQVQGSHDGTLDLREGERASFWVRFLAPNGFTVAKATAISVYIPGTGELRTRVFSEADTRQQLIVSALAPGIVSGLPASTDLAATCTAGSITIAGSHPIGVAMPGAYAETSVQNTGRRTCSLGGVPRIEFVDATGKPIRQHRQTQGPHRATINLAPRAVASFSVFESSCPQDDGASATTIRGREILSLNHLRIASPLHLITSTTSSCPLIVSPIVGGVLHMGPGFTTP
jgi:hypothetical protein